MNGYQASYLLFNLIPKFQNYW